jgi:hypothetical protein
MIYNTQDYWVFGLSIVWYSKIHKKNTTFQKLDLFPSSVQ